MFPNAKLFLIILLLILPGCGTLLNNFYFADYEGGQRIYGGVSNDFHLLSRAIAPVEGELSYTPTIESRINNGLFAVVDMPVSFIADTFSLPFTATCTLVRNSQEFGKKQAWADANKKEHPQE